MIVNKSFVMPALHTMQNKPLEHEISLGNKATLSQSELIQMYFTCFDACECCFYFLKQNKLAFDCTFECYGLKKNKTTDLDRD